MTATVCLAVVYMYVSPTSVFDSCGIYLITSDIVRIHLSPQLMITYTCMSMLSIQTYLFMGEYYGCGSCQ